MDFQHDCKLLDELRLPLLDGVVCKGVPMLPNLGVVESVLLTAVQGEVIGGETSP